MTAESNHTNLKLVVNPHDVDTWRKCASVDAVINCLLDNLRCSGFFRRKFCTAATDLPALREAVGIFGNQRFLLDVWPKIVGAAASAGTVFEEGRISLLQEIHSDRSTSFGKRSCCYTRSQLRCLVAHQFLCTIIQPPWFADTQHNWCLYPWFANETPATAAYNQCLFHYFKADDSTLSFKDIEKDGRECVYDDSPPADGVFIALASLHSSVLPPYTVGSARRHVSFETGTRMEDCVRANCTLDFANACVSFGSWGTQEEMLFGLHPELLAASLLLPQLADHQTCFFGGVMRVAEFEGAGSSLRLVRLLDAFPRSNIIAADALDFSNPDSESETSMHAIHREFVKLKCAFLLVKAMLRGPACVSTGAWGCGAFGATRSLKLCIQAIAAADAAFRSALDDAASCSALDDAASCSALDDAASCSALDGTEATSADVSLCYHHFSGTTEEQLALEQVLVSASELSLHDVGSLINHDVSNSVP